MSLFLGRLPRWSASLIILCAILALFTSPIAAAPRHESRASSWNTTSAERRAELVEKRSLLGDVDSAVKREGATTNVTASTEGIQPLDAGNSNAQSQGEPNSTVEALLEDAVTTDIKRHALRSLLGDALGGLEGAGAQLNGTSASSQSSQSQIGSLLSDLGLKKRDLVEMRDLLGDLLGQLGGGASGQKAGNSSASAGGASNAGGLSGLLGGLKKRNEKLQRDLLGDLLGQLGGGAGASGASGASGNSTASASANNNPLSSLLGGLKQKKTRDLLGDLLGQLGGGAGASGASGNSTASASGNSNNPLSSLLGGLKTRQAYGNGHRMRRFGRGFTRMSEKRSEMLMEKAVSPMTHGFARKGGQGQGQGQTPQQQAAQIPGGVSQATDGSTILDKTVMINNLPIRYRLSGPANMFTTSSGVQGGAMAPGAQGPMGINVLLHGDGGSSFFDFPNQAVQNNLMGVAVLAPDENLFWGGGSGLNRVNGTPHAQAVNDLIKNQIPQDMAFNQSNVFFTGVSGGSLTLSGFFIPAQMTNFKNAGVELNCGAMPPMVPFTDANAVITSTRIHYQSTQNELQLLQGSIPQAVTAYEQVAKDAGMTPDQIGQMQTINNAPQGSHCAFDGQTFTSGNQLIANNYANIIQPGASGNVQGIGNVLTSVVGNENPTFGQPLPVV